MDDKKAVLEAICDIFTTENEEWMAAGKIAAHLTERLNLRPPTTATILNGIMSGIGIEMETRKRGHRPTQGYSADMCRLFLENSDEVLDSYIEVAPIQAQPDGESLKRNASEVLTWISSLEPLWRDRIEALKQERGFDDIEALTSLCGYTLDNSLHMIVPKHPILEGVPWQADEKNCPECGVSYHEKYPSQATCGAYQCGKSYNEKLRLAAVG
jgi:hypothetical protein